MGGVEGGVLMAKEPIILSDQIIPPPALVRAGQAALAGRVAANAEAVRRRARLQPA